MHTDRLMQIVRAIQDKPEMYDQRFYGEPGCGTPGCVAGWAYHFAMLSRQKTDTGSIIDVAEDWLELKHYEADRLFMSYWPPVWFEAARLEFPWWDWEKRTGSEVADGAGVDAVPPSPGEAIKILSLIAHLDTTELRRITTRWIMEPWWKNGNRGYPEMVVSLRASEVKEALRDPESGVVRIDRATRWGNPFKIDSENSREDVIERYREHLYLEVMKGNITKSELAELAGKMLACWCKPEPCHGDVLARAAAWAKSELGEVT